MGRAEEMQDEMHDEIDRMHGHFYARGITRVTASRQMDFFTELSRDSKYLQSCEIDAPVLRMEPYSLVIYGGSGDLATRKLLPTLFRLYQQGELPDEFSIIGVGLPHLADDAYRARMFAACRAALGDEFEPKRWDAFSRLLSSVGGAFDDRATYATLLTRLRELGPRCGNKIIHYLAVPPDIARPSTSGPASSGTSSRIICSSSWRSWPWNRRSASRPI